MVSVKKASVTDKVPPHVFFLVSAVFHYLGPAFAVLLFAHVSVLGVAWLRIASAAVVFALWRRPWRMFIHSSWSTRRILIALGVVLGLMNACFYLAIARIPLGTVGAIEFIGPIILASLGARTPRNLGALLFAAVGGLLLTGARLGGEPLGFVFACANCILFMLYIILGHRIILTHEGGTNMGTNPLRKNRGNDTSRKLKSHIFYPFFPQSKSATIRIPLMSQYAPHC